MWVRSAPITHQNGILYGLVPGCVVPAALGVFCVAIYCYLGRLSIRGNLVCVGLLPTLLVYAIVCDPLYTAVFFPPLGILAVGVLLGSGSRQVFYWRIAASGVCLLATLALNLHGFYRGLIGYTARSAFPNELYVEVQRWDGYTALVFQGGLSTAAIVAVIIGCLLICVLHRGQVRMFAIAVLVFLATIVAVCLIYVYSGIHWSLPLPVYIELPARPAYVIAALLGLWLGRTSALQALCQRQYRPDETALAESCHTSSIMDVGNGRAGFGDALRVALAAPSKARGGRPAGRTAAGSQRLSGNRKEL